MDRREKAKKAKVGAKRPPVRKTPSDRDSKLRDLEKSLAEALQQLDASNRELTEARDQQAATSEILRVISKSASDYQPVFDTIVRNAGVVCGAADAILWTVDGDELVTHAHHGPLPALIGNRQPIRGSVAGYAVHEGRVIHIEDVTEADDFPVGRRVSVTKSVCRLVTCDRQQAINRTVVGRSVINRYHLHLVIGGPQH